MNNTISKTKIFGWMNIIMLGVGLIVSTIISFLFLKNLDGLSELSILNNEQSYLGTFLIIFLYLISGAVFSFTLFVFIYFIFNLIFFVKCLHGVIIKPFFIITIIISSFGLLRQLLSIYGILTTNKSIYDIILYFITILIYLINFLYSLFALVDKKNEMI